MKLNNKWFNEYGFSARIDQRFYDTESIEDALHAGRSHTDQKYDLWIKVNINENVNLKYLKRANLSVDRMINIVDDLEVISQLETNENVLDLDNFNIVDTINEAFDQLEMKANNMNISLKLTNESNSDMVHADRNKIQQVFMNLISNSIKYGKDNGVTNVRLFDMTDKMLIEVADDGIGIGEEALNRLFERFYRVDKNRSREIGGTGLGLAIVKHIIEAHQQTINVRSTVDVGSTFSFILEKGKN